MPLPNPLAWTPFPSTSLPPWSLSDAPRLLYMTWVEAGLREWWRSADAATRERHLVASEHDDQVQKAIRTAARFKVDKDLEMWVEAQNVQKGISPLPGLMSGRANEIKEGHGVPTPRTRKGSRKWLARWRARRTVRLRSMPAHERLCVEEIHQKVILGQHDQYCSTFQFKYFRPPSRRTRQKVGPFSGPSFRGL